jgi:hypothetical protein
MDRLAGAPRVVREAIGAFGQAELLLRPVVRLQPMLY